MTNFERYSMLWLLGLIAIIALFYIVRAVLGYQRVAQDAKSDYIYKSENNMIDDRISKEGYIRAYKRFYAPRNHAYIGGGILAVAVLTPLALGFIQYVSMFFWINAGRPPIYAPHGFVWQFIQYFATIAFWGLIAYTAARLYHRGAPKSLRDEMMRERKGK